MSEPQDTLNTTLSGIIEDIRRQTLDGFIKCLVQEGVSEHVIQLALAQYKWTRLVGEHSRMSREEFLARAAELLAERERIEAEAGK